MKISDKGLELIKEYEGRKLATYKDSVGILTIGYGHTHNVRSGDVISEKKALEYLKEDAMVAEIVVESNVSVHLTQGQFDALTSFVFNVGAKKFVGSTLLRKLNNGDYEGAAKEFVRWVYAGKKELPGLVKRRDAEERLFLS